MDCRHPHKPLKSHQVTLPSAALPMDKRQAGKGKQNERHMPYSRQVVPYKFPCCLPTQTTTTKTRQALHILFWEQNTDSTICHNDPYTWLAQRYKEKRVQKQRHSTLSTLIPLQLTPIYTTLSSTTMCTTPDYESL